MLSGDGVVPVSQLSFTKAEEAHFKGAKKMGDVGSRSAMNSYFDHLGEEQQAAHKAALKHAFSGQSLNQWFNKMGQKYFKATEVPQLTCVSLTIVERWYVHHLLKVLPTLYVCILV